MTLYIVHIRAFGAILKEYEEKAAKCTHFEAFWVVSHTLRAAFAHHAPRGRYRKQLDAELRRLRQEIQECGEQFDAKLKEQNHERYRTDMRVFMQELSAGVFGSS